MLWEAIKLANQSVRRNVLRSILTLLGIVIGVSAVIAMVTIGNGTTQKVTEDLSKLGSNMLVARPGRETFGAGGGGADVRSFTERNVATLRSELADVRGIAPTATRAARVVYGAENYDTTVTGTESDFFVVQDWTFESGRPFSDGDIRSASSVCVIGQTVKTVLFGQADPLGLRLRLGGLSCEVIGVLNGKGQSAFGSDQDNTVVMPLRTFQRRIAGNQRISTIYIAVASTDSIPTVQAAAEDILREQRRVAPDEENDFSVRDMTQMVSTLTSTTTAMTGLLERRCGGEPAGRRHRHHEHHAGIGHRAHARDRHQAGHRRSGETGAHPVPGRSRCPCGFWRHCGNSARPRDCRMGDLCDGGSLHGESKHRRPGLCVFRPDRRGLWLFPGAARGAPRSHRGAAPRVVAPTQSCERSSIVG